MRRVLVLNQFALPRDQGGGTRHADLFSRCPGWRSVVLTGDRNHYSQKRFTTDDPGFRLLPVPASDGSPRARLASWVAYCVQALGFGLRHRPDVVFASSPHLLTAVAGWTLARMIRVPLVLEIRDLWPESFVAAGLLTRGSPPHRVLEAIERFVVRRADEIVVVTPGWEQHLSRLGADLQHCTIVPNGTEPYDLHLSSNDREKRRRSLGIDRTTAVFAGAHGPKDGIDLILDAAASIPEVDFLLVGDGPAKDDAQSRARREGLSNVRFTDPVPKQDLPVLLACCDIGVHSVTPLDVFRLGMSPNKLFDYLAAGLPVVSNAGDAVTGLIGRDRCGHVGDSGSLADGIRLVQAADDQQRATWRHTAHTLIRTRFSRGEAARCLATVLDRVCDDHAGRRTPR
ncbi:glycosyltransferase family 4 protein [Arsenicicoccus dermatophilus]|uniref:glycosyltransferase family 4 protein n=1 Tax=Arsenicicoccus dermatophilus TaxID=1076331 RepID=UPI001F4C6154|nr:glycosyltransferase family 4 protein [Arsenicicoccus dermatophilus]MCH8613718.1 glycosyltransferase family 4 protein [Arsenicicoccus dermatophilus]